MTTINSTNYVEEAEKSIKKLKGRLDKYNKPIPMVTTSKIRNLLSMTADIYNQVLIQTEDKLDDELSGRIEYLRVRFIYESGREQAVKNFTEDTGVLEVLKEVKGSKANYILFNRYMEALVAFHKYYGGKD